MGSIKNHRVKTPMAEMSQKALRKLVATMRNDLDSAEKKIAAIELENGQMTAVVKRLQINDDNLNRKLLSYTEQFGVVNRRLDKIETRIMGFLDKDQMEVMQMLPTLDPIEYGLNYLKMLHDNKDIISSVRHMSHR